MIRYLIIMLSCQLLFLLVYDLFLKKETFFNWNRVYLLITPLLSLCLPLIRVDALKTSAPEPLVNAVPVIFLEPAETAVVEVATTASGWNLDAWQWIALAGSGVALGFFVYKLAILFRLRKIGVVRRFREYLQVEVPQSEVAFSFFRQIFLGRKVMERKHDHIIEHELVHIREKHSWDLLYFEVLRIVFWFNPLVYIFQARMTELHEYIADAKMAGNHKKDTYQYLLEEVFQTQKISFINSFFNHSLIKKRIQRLHQSRSKQINKFKYLLMIPLVLGMLLYTSCEQGVNNKVAGELVIENVQLKKYYEYYKNQNLSKEELNATSYNIYQQGKKEGILSEEEFYRSRALLLIETRKEMERVGLTVPATTIPLNDELFSYKAYVKKEIQRNSDPITMDQTPVKPSFPIPCEDAQEAFQCFKSKLDAHVFENFHYPEEAKENKEEGTAYVFMKIDIDGKVHVVNVECEYQSLADEARLIIESLPVLNPGADENGNPININFVYPIVFKMADKETLLSIKEELKKIDSLPINVVGKTS